MFLRQIHRYFRRPFASMASALAISAAMFGTPAQAAPDRHVAICDLGNQRSEFGVRNLVCRTAGIETVEQGDIVQVEVRDGRYAPVVYNAGAPTPIDKWLAEVIPAVADEIQNNGFDGLDLQRERELATLNTPAATPVAPLAYTSTSTATGPTTPNATTIVTGEQVVASPVRRSNIEVSELPPARPAVAQTPAVAGFVAQPNAHGRFVRNGNVYTRMQTADGTLVDIRRIDNVMYRVFRKANGTEGFSANVAGIDRATLVAYGTPVVQPGAAPVAVAETTPQPAATENVTRTADVTPPALSAEAIQQRIDDAFATPTPPTQMATVPDPLTLSSEAIQQRIDSAFAGITPATPATTGQNPLTAFAGLRLGQNPQNPGQSSMTTTQLLNTMPPASISGVATPVDAAQPVNGQPASTASQSFSEVAPIVADTLQRGPAVVAPETVPMLPAAAQPAVTEQTPTTRAFNNATLVERQSPGVRQAQRYLRVIDGDRTIDIAQGWRMANGTNVAFEHVVDSNGRTRYRAFDLNAMPDLKAQADELAARARQTAATPRPRAA